MLTFTLDYHHHRHTTIKIVVAVQDADEGDAGAQDGAAPGEAPLSRECVATRQPNVLAMMQIPNEMFYTGPPIAHSDFGFETEVSHEKEIAKRLGARGEYFKQILIRVMVRHRLRTYFSTQKTHVHVTQQSATLIHLQNKSTVSQGNVRGVVESIQSDDLGTLFVLANVTGGHFSVRGGDLEIKMSNQVVVVHR